MKLTPPLRRKGVEVTSINEGAHTVSCIVHVRASAKDVHTMEFTHHVSTRVQDMMRYLEMEGYINLKDGKWLTHRSVVLHPPGGSDNLVLA